MATANNDLNATKQVALLHFVEKTKNNKQNRGRRRGAYQDVFARRAVQSLRDACDDARQAAADRDGRARPTAAAAAVRRHRAVDGRRRHRPVVHDRVEARRRQVVRDGERRRRVRHVGGEEEVRHQPAGGSTVRGGVGRGAASTRVRLRLELLRSQYLMITPTITITITTWSDMMTTILITITVV